MAGFLFINITRQKGKKIIMMKKKLEKGKLAMVGLLIVVTLCGEVDQETTNLVNADGIAGSPLAV